MITPFSCLARTSFAIALAASAARLSAAEELDRLLAAVNGRVVTSGDLGFARSVNAVLSASSAVRPSAGDDDLVRAIDLELVRQELESSPGLAPAPARVEAELEKLAAVYAAGAGLAARLAELGISVEELREALWLRLRTENFIDARFRPLVSVSADEKEAYHRLKLEPELRRAGAAVPALAEVEARIEQILTEEKINAALESWLDDVRRHARIELFTPGAVEARP